MTRRRALAVAAMGVVAFAATLLGLAAPASATVDSPAGVNDFIFRSLDVQYYLDRDDAGHATLRTIETFVAVFPDIDQNHGLLRQIPLAYGGDTMGDPKRVDTELDVVSVTDENGRPRSFETSDDNGFLDVAIRSGDFLHGPTTYVIEYTQKHVARAFADVGDDEFYWDVNGTGWGQPFGTISADIHLAPDLRDALTGDFSCYWGYEGSTDTCPIEQTTDGFHVSQEGISASQNVTFAIGFELGTFTPGPKVEDNWIVKVLPWVLLGILAAIVAAIIVLRRTRWAHAPGRGIVVPQYEGPATVGVMPAAAFLGNASRGLPAELVNLAVRGIARLVEDPSEPEHRRYRLEVIDRSAATDTDDDTALRKLLPKNLNKGVLVLDQKSRQLGDRIASLIALATATPKARKLVSRGTSKITRWLRLTAFACFALGWFVVIWAGNAGVASGLLTFQLIAIIVGSLVVIGFAGVPERRTALGSEVLEHLQGLRDYLELAEADRLRVLQSPQGAQRSRVDPNDDAQVVKLYEKLLPWAMVFGIEDKWSKVLGEKYATTQIEPSNVQLSSGLVGLTAFSMSAQSSSFATTPPVSSSSSSSGSSSSFGGSSGGGFSGGGGGGGGGGGL